MNQNVTKFNQLGVDDITSNGELIEITKVQSTKSYTNANECPLTMFMQDFGGKWKAVILWLLHKRGVLRYSELDGLIVGASQKVLSAQLKDLEKSGVVSRKVYASVPPKVEYDLTEKGESLIEVLRVMLNWTNENHLDVPVRNYD